MVKSRREGDKEIGCGCGAGLCTRGREVRRERDGCHGGFVDMRRDRGQSTDRDDDGCFQSNGGLDDEDMVAHVTRALHVATMRWRTVVK